jgi:hypothetical protein
MMLNSIADPALMPTKSLAKWHFKSEKQDNKETKANQSKG